MIGGFTYSLAIDFRFNSSLLKEKNIYIHFTKNILHFPSVISFHEWNLLILDTNSLTLHVQIQLLQSAVLPGLSFGFRTTAKLQPC